MTLTCISWYFHLWLCNTGSYNYCILRRKAQIKNDKYQYMLYKKTKNWQHFRKQQIANFSRKVSRDTSVSNRRPVFIEQPLRNQRNLTVSNIKESLTEGVCKGTLVRCPAMLYGAVTWELRSFVDTGSHCGL